MSQASDPGAKLIASYRAATRMRPEQRERALRKLQARLSTDPTPSIRPEVSVPELPPQLPAAWVQLRARWRRFATVSRVIIGAALLTWLATEPDAHGGVAPVPLDAAAARPGSNAGAETEPRAPLSTPARSQLATPSDAASSGHRKSAPAAPHETHITSAGGASSKLAHMPRTAATPAQLPERGARQLGAASLEQETLLLEQAQAALKRGDAERALHLLAEHTWLFPAGHLAEARDVARILALCQAGNAAQARLRAKSFLAARPHSPFAARVSSSCPDADKPPNAK